MKPLTLQEKLDIIAQVKVDILAKTESQKFYDVIRDMIERQLDNGLAIDDPRIDDGLKAFIDNADAVTKGRK